MQKLGFIGMKSLDQFKSLQGSVGGTAKSLSSSSRSPSESITLGSFTSLKLTAEKLVKEQASVRTDLDLANSKLKKSVEDIHKLEEKLQTTLNENAKLKVKQKEDDKLWQGLESKFSSTKSHCDQLTQNLQILAGQVQDSEKDRHLTEDKLFANSAAVDKLTDQVNRMSLELQSADETIKDQLCMCNNDFYLHPSVVDKALKKLCLENEEKEAFYKDQQSRSVKLAEEKDALIKCLEADVAASRLTTENLKFKLDDASMQLRLKEEDLIQLRASLQNLERKNADLRASNTEFANKLATSLQEKENLHDMVIAFATKLSEMDKQSLALADKIAQLCSVHNSCGMLAKQERELEAKRAQQQYDQLHHQYLHIRLEKDELQSTNEKLNDKVNELQRAQESLMVQHAEECHLTEERIRKLESEEEILLSNKCELQKSVIELQKQVQNLSASLQSSENEMKEVLLKVSLLESENKKNVETLEAELHKKEGEIDVLQKVIEKRKQQEEFLEKQVNQLNNTLKEKEQLILQSEGREQHLEDQKAEIQALLAAAESKLTEAKKQYDSMLESKQAELSRHLKEISQRNDQAITDIRKKYEEEKQEIVNLEKEKVEKIIADMERHCEKRLEQCKEESRQQLNNIQEEHIALIKCMQEEHEKKEVSINADHLHELKRVELQAANELREKTKMLMNEHEVQIRAVRLQHEDECRQLQEELHLQKSKEERQRALLQLQWKVMGDKPHEEQEVNSKRDYTVSSLRMRNPNQGIRSMHAPTRPQVEEKDSPYLAAVQSPMSTLLKTVEKANSGMDISKHSRKVTHHEYEVETNNEGTVTKRRKTRSTVTFGDPRKQKKAVTPKANTPRTSVKGRNGGGYSKPSNIGDLFTEGSLNPYADDPYAFD
ncbi:hypothetical protein Ancab_036374 [Ancistrocladus abbreviatus]